MSGGPAGLLIKGALGNLKKSGERTSANMQQMAQPMPSINDLAAQSNFGQQAIPAQPPTNPADPQNIQETIERLRRGLGRDGRREALGGLLDMIK